MMKITGHSHLFKWENLHNWWLPKYLFAPLYMLTRIQYIHMKWVKQHLNIIQMTSDSMSMYIGQQPLRSMVELPGGSWLATMIEVQGRVLGGGWLVVTGDVLVYLLYCYTVL